MNIETIFSAVTGAVAQVAEDYWNEPVGRCAVCKNEISRGEYTLLRRYEFNDGCTGELMKAWEMLNADPRTIAEPEQEEPTTVDDRIAADVRRPTARMGLNETPQPARATPRVRSNPPPQAPVRR